MKRGCTRPLVIDVDKDFRDCAKVVLTLKWLGGSMDFYKDDLDITSSTVTAHLTQEQALSLPSTRVRLQIKFEEDGVIDATDEAQALVADILNTEVL